MKETNAALDKIERKESFFEQMQSTKRARKPLNVLHRFQSKLNEERKGFALEKCAEFIDFKLL